MAIVESRADDKKFEVDFAASNGNDIIDAFRKKAFI